MNVTELRSYLLNRMACVQACTDVSDNPFYKGKAHAYSDVLNALEAATVIYPIRPDCQIAGLANLLFAQFGNLTDGTFIEIGAFDGISWSNTYGLAQLGWDGVYVEPVLKYFNKCRQNHANHPRVHVLNALVSSARRRMQIHIREGDIATVDERFIKEMHLENSAIEELEAVTLDDVLQQMEISAGFELLVIDVEGHEPDVLKGFDVELYVPQMIIIETHEKSTYSLLNHNVGFIDGYMHEHGYVKIYADHINSVFVLAKQV